MILEKTGSRVTFQELLTGLNCKKLSDGSFQCFCPAHDDKNPSLHVTLKNEKILFKCFAGCDYKSIVDALKIRNLWPVILDNEPKNPTTTRRPPRRSKKSNGKIVETYNYFNENKKLLFQILRFEPKTFRIRRPDGKGGWIWGLGNMKPTLYRLPELIEAVKKGKTIYVVEGEKDCENLSKLGLVSTTCPMGAGKWRDEFSRYFENADICIIPDNDSAGLKHAEQVAESLFQVAKSIKVVKLPDLPPKGDVTDWIMGGGTKQQLLKLVDETPEWEPSEGSEPSESSELEIGLSEYDFSLKIVKDHGEIIKYCPQKKEWYLWNGIYWKPDILNQVPNLAIKSLLSIYKLLPDIQDSKKRKQIALKIERCKTNRFIQEALKFTGRNQKIAILHESLNPDIYKFTTLNKTIHLKLDGIIDIYDPKPSDLITMQMPVLYDKDAKCPRWEQFLSEIFNEDKELINWIQKIAGYSLSGDVSEMQFYILHGSGRNGKSVFINTLLDLFGDYGATTNISTFSNYKDKKRNDLAILTNKRFVSINESNYHQRINEALIKAITGGDRITSRFLYQEYFSYYPEYKVFLSTNYKPIIKDLSPGFWERIKLIPFEVTFIGKEADPLLRQKLKAEFSGILSWLLVGWKKYRTEGLDPEPEKVKIAVSEYHNESDEVLSFLKLSCRTIETQGIDVLKSFTLREMKEEGLPYIKLSTLYERFLNENKKSDIGKKEFTQRLINLGYIKKRFKDGLYIFGVGLDTI